MMTLLPRSTQTQAQHRVTLAQASSRAATRACHEALAAARETGIEHAIELDDASYLMVDRAYRARAALSAAELAE